MILSHWTRLSMMLRMNLKTSGASTRPMPIGMRGRQCARLTRQQLYKLSKLYTQP